MVEGGSDGDVMARWKMSEWPEAVVVLVAVLGGIANELHRYLTTGSLGLTVLRVAAIVFVSGFTGTLGWFVAQAFMPEIAIPIVGACGWFGGKTFERVEDVAASVLQARRDKK